MSNHPKRLEGKHAVITGATRGIGKEIARAFCAEGAHVVTIARNFPEDMLPASVHIPTDLSRLEDIRSLAESIKEIDILVHSAGVYERSSIAEASIESLSRQFAVNVMAPFLLTMLMLPKFRLCNGGDIVFINSTQGLEAGKNISQYAITKHGLKAMADSLRLEVNELGIRVLTLYLGRTATPGQEEIYRAEGRNYEPEHLLQPESVAEIVVAAMSLPRTAEITSLTIRPALKTY